MTNINVVVSKNLFPSMGATFSQRVEDALDDAVLTCMEVATPLVRVDTGALRSNVTIERPTYGRVITWNQDYAVYQNMGTVFMEGTHYADKGVEAAEPVLTDGLKGIFT